MAGGALAAAVAPATDAELDAVSARGLDYLFDANALLASGFSSGGWYGQSSLGNSITLSGGSRQSGIGIVNAINSTVNMPINITILINSSVSGGLSLGNYIGGLGR